MTARSAPSSDAPDPDRPLDADADLVEGRALPSDRVALDRDRILLAALDHIDELGLPGLTMRRLGQRLGVEAMSLYRYVPGKEELLDGVVEILLAQLYDDDDVRQSPTDGWQDFLQRLAHGVRRVALTHPRAFPLVASRPPEAPWLRPPLRSLDWVETFLVALSDEGFGDEAVVAAYRAFTSFLLGHLLLEVANLGADIGPLDVLDDGEADHDEAAQRRTVWRLRRELAEDHAAAEFEEALEVLLERLTRTRVELADGSDLA
ncbi:hypothetical protein GCM10027596_03720 [Nocardioides korecus]